MKFSSALTVFLGGVFFVSSCDAHPQEDALCHLVSFSSFLHQKRYYLTGDDASSAVYLHSASKPPHWAVSFGLPVPVDEDPHQPGWFYIFYEKNTDRWPTYKLFLASKSDARHRRDQIVLYPALPGYYANKSARFDFYPAADRQHIHLVLRHMHLYLVPENLQVALKKGAGTFSGWQVADALSGTNCVPYFLKYQGRTTSQ